MEKKLRVVAFGAHPDDIEVYMSGTLLKYKEQCHEIYMVIVTDGCRGGVQIDVWGNELVEIRKREAFAAAAHIGVEPIFLGFEDHRLIHDIQTYDKIAETIDRIKPDVIFTHDPNDYHGDHRATSQLVLDASFVPVFFADTLMGNGFEPQFYVDITAQFETKSKMLKEHVSQGTDVLVEMMEIQNRFRGAQCGISQTKYAEAFRLFPCMLRAKGYELLP